MRRADHRRSGAVCELDEERADLDGRRRIETRGRLVGDDDGCPRGECAGERDALALTGRQELHSPIRMRGEADRREGLGCPGARLVVRDAAEREAELDVLTRGEEAGEPRRLADDSDVFAPKRARAARSSDDTTVSARRTSPSSGTSMPVRRARSVDLPEPDGPTTTVSLPGSNVALTSSRAA